jgi:hypothetical protein
MRISELQKINEHLYNTLLLMLSQTSHSETLSEIIKEAQMLYNNYESNEKQYEHSIRFMKQNSSRTMTHSEFNSFISFVNWNGSETYFTRGAFLDVVVNQQMCKKRTVNLSKDEYLDSFIENMSDLLLHYDKQKYLLRANDAVTNLHLKNPLDKVKTLFSTCNDTNPLQCTPFMFAYECVKAILDTCNLHFKQFDHRISEIKDILNKFESFVERPLRALENINQLNESAYLVG